MNKKHYFKQTLSSLKAHIYNSHDAQHKSKLLSDSIKWTAKHTSINASTRRGTAVEI